MGGVRWTESSVLTLFAHRTVFFGTVCSTSAVCMTGDTYFVDCKAIMASGFANALCPDSSAYGLRT